MSSVTRTIRSRKPTYILPHTALCKLNTKHQKPNQIQTKSVFNYISNQLEALQLKIIKRAKHQRKHKVSDKHRMTSDLGRITSARFALGERSLTSGSWERSDSTLQKRNPVPIRAVSDANPVAVIAERSESNQSVHVERSESTWLEIDCG